MNQKIRIGDKRIGKGEKCFIVAEMSGNHNMSFERAEEIVRSAAKAGADAVKLQTYTADTITLDSDRDCFRTSEHSLWAGTTLYELYQRAYTPWEWQPKLKRIAEEEGLLCFSSPFDLTAVDFLEEMDVPAYKIASFEIGDIPLLKKVARTGKPIIIATGIASMADIETAIGICRDEGNDNVILLKCTSEYPAPYADMNLRMIPSMAETFGVPAGLSDHSMGDEVAIAGVALGACMVEKHMTLRRADGGVDSAFSMEPDEMEKMVRRIRHAEEALGRVDYALSEGQKMERRNRRSLFACADIRAGEIFSEENIKSVRPGIGLPTAYYEQILGKKARRDIEYAKPLELADIEW